MIQKIFLCEDSIEGIFTGVYNAWESRYPKDYIKLSSEQESNYELFSETIDVETDIEKASKVARTIENDLVKWYILVSFKRHVQMEKIKRMPFLEPLILGWLQNPRSLMDNLKKIVYVEYLN